MPDSKILVTGATGFLGSHIIAESIRRGYQVRGTLRSAKRGPQISAAIEGYINSPVNAEYIETDLTADEGWAEAMQGISAVIHVASPVPIGGEDAEKLISIARDGTLRVLGAAKEAGVKRVVLTSSTAAIVYGHEGAVQRPFTEEDWTNPEGKDVYPYVLSKYFAERAAWEYAEANGMELSTINPGIIFGPVLEKDYGSSAEAVRKLMAGEFPGAPRIGWTAVDVRDVARLHVDSIENEAAIGQRFLATSEYLTIRDIAGILKEEFPEYAKKMPGWTMPNWLVRAFALFDKETRGVLPELDIHKDADSSKAQRIFNWKPISGREAVTATARSLQEFGIV